MTEANIATLTHDQLVDRLVELAQVVHGLRQRHPSQQVDARRDLEAVRAELLRRIRQVEAQL